MPDLSEISTTLTFDYALSSIFGPARIKDARLSVWLRVYIRLTDKSLLDYELCRACFERYTAQSGSEVLPLLFRAIGHMENCLESLYRAIRLLERMQSVAAMRSAIDQPRVLCKPVYNLICSVRNSVQHMDERILNAKVKPGDLSTLWMDEESITLENRTITYQELAEWLREIHTLATSLAHFRQD